jgi:biofilm PGA synthesis N-glycosyltransferase PgaC
MQEWDYFLGIASVKRMQGLYQGTLVAQGAFSLYRTQALRAAGGWPDAIGEDIVLTWRLIGGPLPQVPQTEERAGETPG